MSASPGGACMSQCKHWRIHLFFLPAKRMQAIPSHLCAKTEQIFLVFYFSFFIKNIPNKAYILAK